MNSELGKKIDEVYLSFAFYSDYFFSSKYFISFTMQLIYSFID